MMPGSIVFRATTGFPMFRMAGMPALMMMTVPARSVSQIALDVGRPVRRLIYFRCVVDRWLGIPGRTDIDRPIDIVLCSRLWCDG